MNKNISGLENYRKEMAEKKRNSVIKAVNFLYEMNEVVNFRSVSKKAGVSRKYLYSHNDLSALIRQHNESSIKRNEAKLVNFKAKANSEQNKLKTLSLKCQKLAKENKALKEEIKVLREYIERIQRPPSTTT